MLVLARRIGESINIGDNISIKLVRISGNQVRIAIDAPKDINIVRSELNCDRSVIEDKLFDKK